jgi:hypothetical protein
MISGYFQVFFVLQKCFLLHELALSFSLYSLLFRTYFAKFVSSMRLHTFVSELCGDFYKSLIFVHIFQYLPELVVLHVLVQTFIYLNPKLG